MGWRAARALLTQARSLPACAFDQQRPAPGTGAVPRGQGHAVPRKCPGPCGHAARGNPLPRVPATAASQPPPLITPIPIAPVLAGVARPWHPATLSLQPRGPQVRTRVCPTVPVRGAGSGRALALSLPLSFSCDAISIKNPLLGTFPLIGIHAARSLSWRTGY